MLTQATDLTDLGFDSDLLNIKDQAKLTGYLSSAIVCASARLRKWVSENYSDIEALAVDNEKRMRFAKAELFLSMAEILPDVHARSSVGETSIGIDGFTVKIAEVTADESIQICRALADKASQILIDSHKPSEYSGVAFI